MAVPAERQALLGHKRPVLQQQCSQDAPNLDSVRVWPREMVERARLTLWAPVCCCPLAQLDVYNSIHRVFRDIKDYLDVPLTGQSPTDPYRRALSNHVLSYDGLS